MCPSPQSISAPAGKPVEPERFELGNRAVFEHQRPWRRSNPLSDQAELVGRSPRDYEHAFALYPACLLDSMNAR